MGRMTPITLGGAEHNLFYGAESARTIPALLRQMGKLTPAENIGDAANLVRRGDFEAVNVCLQVGLLHEPDGMKLDGKRVDRWLDDALRDDRVEEIRDAILAAMFSAKLIRQGVYEPERPPAEGGDVRPTRVGTTSGGSPMEMPG